MVVGETWLAAASVAELVGFAAACTEFAEA
jgi:hypothetical protein